jgi:protein-disulfide isomerase
MFLCLLNVSHALEANYEALYQNPLQVKEILRPKDHEIYLGKKDAPVTIIEYSSLSCFHCGDFHKKIFATLKEKFIDTGVLKYVYRDFPLNVQAVKGACLAHCAGDEQFFLFLKILFEKQESWAYQKNYLQVLENIGKLGGLTQERLTFCLNDKAYQEKVLSKMLEANTIMLQNNQKALSGTPAFFINGKMFNQAMNVESFSKEINLMAQEKPKE